MSDKYRIDSHKLMYHPERIAEWLSTGDCYPIYAEFSPSGACNHRCTFCGLDFVGYQPRFLDYQMLRERLAEMGRLGLKSVMHGGEGEPLLHRQIAEIIECGKENGIDQAITTNAVLLTPELARRILPRTEWIKISINAGTPQTYEAIHRGRPQDFRLVLDNIAEAVRIKHALGTACTIGLQMILLPENRAEAVTLARHARDIGADYLVIKPYSQHISSETRAYESVTYAQDVALGEELAAFNSAEFSVIFRAETMQNWDKKKISYKRCLALPFWTYVDAGGDVWGCSIFLGDERFCYGNLNENTFEEIWHSQRRREHLAMMREHWDMNACRINCRMDKVNCYLDEIANPPGHVNFI